MRFALPLAGLLILLIVPTLVEPSAYDAYDDFDQVLLAGSLDPAQGRLLILNPTEVPTSEVRTALRGQILDGLEVLIAGDGALVRSFANVLDPRIVVSTGPVLALDASEEGTRLLGASTTRFATDAFALRNPPTQALFQTEAHTFIDQNQDGSPGLTEPRGSWSVAGRYELGEGGITVLPSRTLAADPELVRFLLGDGVLYIDAVHGTRLPDPLGVNQVASEPTPVLLAPALLLAMMATALLTGLLVRRATRRYRMPRLTPTEKRLLEELTP